MGSIHIYTILTICQFTRPRAQRRGARRLPFYLVLLPLAELHVGIGFTALA